MMGSDDPEIAADVPATVMELHDDVVAALIAGDSAAFVRSFSDGATWVDPHGSWTAPVRLQAHFEAGLPWVDFEEIELEDTLYLSVQGYQVLATEWTASGLSGDPALGEKQPFSTGITVVFEIEDGLIAKGFAHFNQAALYNW